jgi:long-chain acyl-CoA synthetase
MKKADTLTIPAKLLEVFSVYSNKPAIIYKKGHHFESLTFKKLKRQVSQFASFLITEGVKKGDRVVILSENRPEWIIADLAIQFLGAVNVPIHSVLTGVQIKQIVDEVEPTIIIVSNSENLTKILEIESVMKNKTPIVYLDEALKKEKEIIKHFKANHIVEAINLHQKIKDNLLEELAVKVSSSDLASIIYTSGTTGKSKGVELTHANFVFNIEAVLDRIKIYPEDRLLSVLPLSHVFERTAGYYSPLFAGASVSYIEDITKVSDYAKEEKPTIILAVPRLYEKIHEKVIQGASKSALKKSLLNFGLNYGKDKNNRTKLLYKILDKIVFSKIKASFGGHIRMFVSGGANLAPYLGEFFDSLGMPIIEGYGLTETSPVVCVNHLSSNKYGTVGPALKGVDLRLASDGEILVKGPLLMRGYYKDIKASKDAFTSDGWFKTGDLGHIDDDNCLTITGRKKEILVLSTGKKIFPVQIEKALEKSDYIDQALVFGDGKKHIAAFIVPTARAVEEFKENIEDKIGSIIVDQLADFSSIEKIKKFALISEPFTVENGFLTPTMKLRRPIILENYASKVDSLY